MNIGIDIDGVITNLDFLSILGTKEPILDREKKATVNTPVARKILFHCIKLYSKHGVIRTNASKYINALKNNGHKIFIITKRRFFNLINNSCFDNFFNLTIFNTPSQISINQLI